MAYKLKQNCKHHAWQDGQLVRLNEGAVVDNISSNFKDKFEVIEGEMPEDEVIKLDRPENIENSTPSIPEAKTASQKIKPVDQEEDDESEDDDDEELDDEDDDDEEESDLRIKAASKKGKFIVVDAEGNKVHTGYLSKKKAEEMVAAGA